MAGSQPSFTRKRRRFLGASSSSCALFASSDPLTFLNDYLGPKIIGGFAPSLTEKGFRLALLDWACSEPLQLIYEANKRSLAVMLGARGWLSFFVLTYFGAFMPWLEAWQPLRFKVAFDLFLVIGAAYYALN